MDNQYDPAQYEWHGAPQPPKKKSVAKIVVPAVIAALLLLGVLVGAAACVFSSFKGVFSEPLEAVKTFVNSDPAFTERYGEAPEYRTVSINMTDNNCTVEIELEGDGWQFFLQKKDGAWTVTRYQHTVVEAYEAE